MKALSKTFALTLATLHLGLTMVCMQGCDLAMNPLIFDGTPVEATFPVISPVTLFPPLVYSVDLEDILSESDNAVDSIKAYNITMLIDNPGAANLALTCNMTVNGDTLLTMNNTPASALASERTIFDSKLTALGLSYSPTIVPTINGYLKQNPKPRVTVLVSGVGTPAPLNFTIHVKLYSQVFTGS
ncbi:MAG TPA: hypothetical protein VGR15_11035 [Bacteroidota bacterium]|nr:hypothetical protein [Bacteroidota bacterium]